MAKTAENAQFNNDHRIRMKQTPVMDLKPFLVPYLVKLGVLEQYANTFSVFRAYEVLYALLRKKIGSKRKCENIQPLYWLWTHGIALDALKAFTLEEAKAMLEMIWAAKKAKGTKGNGGTGVARNTSGQG